MAGRLWWMAAALVAVLVAAASIGLAGSGGGGGGAGDVTIILVRHAEKVDESEDPDLSPAGRRRAASLAEALRDSGVSAVYTTTYKRTRQTGAAVADRLKLAPEQRHELARTLSPAQAVERIRSEGAGRAVLVVAHSNTIPPLLRALGWDEPPMPDTEFGRVYVATLRADGTKQLIRAGYPPEAKP
ncbi:MAG: phosphoglycerate mutase family protein [Phycisphaerales bacterium]